MKTYCIFKVYDYKGGELSSDVNLSHKSFIANLSELFENYVELDDLSTKRDRKVNTILDVEDQKSYFDNIKGQLVEAMKDSDFYSTYAGGDGFCGELYEVEDSRMTLVSIKHYLDDIAKYIVTNWK